MSALLEGSLRTTILLFLLFFLGHLVLYIFAVGNGYFGDTFFKGCTVLDEVVGGIFFTNHHTSHIYNSEFQIRKFVFGGGVCVNQI